MLEQMPFLTDFVLGVSGHRLGSSSKDWVLSELFLSNLHSLLKGSLPFDSKFNAVRYKSNSDLLYTGSLYTTSATPFKGVQK